MLEERVTLVRGDTFVFSPTRRLGDISSRTKMWFTVKSGHEQDDDVAQIQVEEGAGLLYIAGSVAGTSGNGSIVVSDATNGIVSVMVAAIETAKLTSSTGLWFWDMQTLTAAGVVSTLIRGELVVEADVTKVVT